MNWLTASAILLATTNFNTMSPKDDEQLSLVINKYSQPLELMDMKSDLDFYQREMPDVMIISPDAPVELYSRFTSTEEDPCMSAICLTAKPEDIEEEKIGNRRIIMVASPTCPPCNQFKSYQVPKLKAAGWDVGMDEESHLQIVTPGQYPAAVWPTFIYMEDGKEVRRHEGYATMRDIQWLLSGDRNSSM